VGLIPKGEEATDNTFRAHHGRGWLSTTLYPPPALPPNEMIPEAWTNDWLEDYLSDKCATPSHICKDCGEKHFCIKTYSHSGRHWDGIITWESPNDTNGGLKG